MYNILEVPPVFSIRLLTKICYQDLLPVQRATSGFVLILTLILEEKPMTAL
jgi:hypothetical protein